MKDTKQARYDAKMARHFHLKFNRGTDAEVIAKLESVPNVQSYIRELIKADIAKN